MSLQQSQEDTVQALARVKLGDALGFETPGIPRLDTGYVVTSIERPLDAEFEFKVIATRPAEDGATYEFTVADDEVSVHFVNPGGERVSAGQLTDFQIIELSTNPR